MLQLLVVYFGPYFIFGIPITRSYRLNAVLIGFALNYAAYFAEIYRGGISAIPEGQYEAAKLLGYSRSQTFVHIVMPQVVKRIIPAVANETITLVKEYISGLYPGCGRDFHTDETVGGIPVFDDAICSCCRILLYF